MVTAFRAPDLREKIISGKPKLLGTWARTGTTAGTESGGEKKNKEGETTAPSPPDKPTTDTHIKQNETKGVRESELAPKMKKTKSPITQHTAVKQKL